MYNLFSLNLKFCVAIFISLLALAVQSAPTISLQSTYAETSQNVTLKVNFSGGTEAYGGINARIELPAGYDFVSLSKGDLLSSGSFTASAVNYNDSTGSGVAFLVYSSSSTFQSDGHLLDLVVTTPANAALGKKPLKFETDSPITSVNVQHAISDALGDKSLTLATSNANLYVISDSSDQNGNGIPDAQDDDDDGDGIPDIYELANNLDPLTDDGALDSDSDGFDNATEYQQGTDVSNANDKPTLLQLSVNATVSNVIDPNSVLGAITVDSEIIGTLTLMVGGIDKQAENNNIGEFYQSAPHAVLSFVSEGFEFSANENADLMIQVDDASSIGDGIFVGATNDASTLSNITSYELALTLEDSSATALTTDAIPNEMPSFSSFDTTKILIMGQDAQGGSFEIHASISSFGALVQSLDVDGDGDTDNFDLLIIQRQLGGVTILAANITLPENVGGSATNGARNNDELKSAALNVISNIDMDIDGDTDSDSFDILMIQRHIGGVSNLSINIQPVTGVGGAGSQGERTLAELRTAIESLLGTN